MECYLVVNFNNRGVVNKRSGLLAVHEMTFFDTLSFVWKRLYDIL